MSDMSKRGTDDCDDACASERGERGKRGKRGQRGYRGHDGRDGCNGDTGPTGSTGPTGPVGDPGQLGGTGPTGNTGPSRLIAAARVRGTDGALLASFGFSSSARINLGTYRLVLADPPANDDAVILSIERTGLNATAVVAGVITVVTFSPANPNNQVDSNFYITVVDAS